MVAPLWILRWISESSRLATEKSFGKVLCMGYARFLDRCHDTFANWHMRLVAEIDEESARTRLTDAQHRLCELVEALEERRIRCTRDLRRA